MPKTRSSTASLVTSWWLSDGDEECPHCGRLFVLEVEFRCPECDGPGCPHCKAVHAEGHMVCVDCAPRVVAPKQTPAAPSKRTRRG
jgi:hypothetical protein